MTEAETDLVGDAGVGAPKQLGGGRFVAVVTGITILVLAAASGLVANLGAGADRRTASASAPTATTTRMVAPAGVLDLSTVSNAGAVEYHYAREHADVYRKLRCWCGCEEAFGHVSLADCFVRPDGGWEAHGAGCGVCLAEAATARERLEAGDVASTIRADLDAQYGPDPTTTGAARAGKDPT